MAGSDPNLPTRFTGTFIASSMSNSHLHAAPLSVSTSMAQQIVGNSIQLADKPILGPAAVQAQTRQAADGSASQADAASAADLNAATHRSPCQASIAMSAADVEASTEECHRSSDSALEGDAEAEANRAGNAVSRAASPPFFFEGNAGEDSLVEFGDTKASSDVTETAMPQRQESTASCLLGSHHQQKAMRNHDQDSNTVSIGFTAQASSQPQQQQQQLGLSRTAASRAEAQPSALWGSQAASLCSKEQTHAAPHAAPHGAAAAAAATLHRPVQQQACGKSLSAQRGGANSAAALTQLTKDTARGQGAGALGPDVAGNSRTKENEDVGMASVVRQVGDAQSRLHRQTALQSTKPATSSKVFG